MSIDNNAVLYVGLPFRELNPDGIFDEPDDLIISFKYRGITGGEADPAIPSHRGGLRV